MVHILQLFTFTVLIGASVAALWPAPRTLNKGTSVLRLSPLFDVKLDIKEPPNDLLDAIKSTKALLLTDSLAMLVVGRGAELQGAINAAKELNTLWLSLETGARVYSIAEEAVADIMQRSEGYTLIVPADGSPARLTANSTLGLFRGLTTFSQLWYDLSGTTYTVEVPIGIADAPAFPYRGFMLDTARNFFPVDSIIHTLDALSWVKINTFHWHIVDSQSFPLKLTKYPELSEAAYSISSVYTEADLQHVVSYGAARGIDVLVEIDMPGHTAAIGTSFPGLVACLNAQPWTKYANEPPAGQLRFADPNVVNFATSLTAAVAANTKSKFFSTGGDELNINCYAEDAQTQKILSSTGQSLEQALDKFTQAVHGTLAQMGKTPVVWEEMVLNHNVTLQKDTVVMVWISSQNVAAAVAKGYRVVHAASDYFYLDCGAGGWVGSNINGNSWCDPFKTWQKAYSFDPYANLNPSQYSLILGGQQLLWSEQSGPENMDPIIWPRAAASAEVFWTGAMLPSGVPRNVTEALPRLNELSFRLAKRNIDTINLQPMWCTLRPGACDLVTTLTETQEAIDNTTDVYHVLRTRAQQMLNNFLDPFGNNNMP